MKIHVMTVGFTSDIFKDLVKTGADKIIALHSEHIDPRNEEAMKNLKAMSPDFESKIIKSKDFKGTVKQMTNILESFPVEAEVFVHIGGGERDLAMALLYSTFFAEHSTKIVCTTHVGNEVRFAMEVVPSLFVLDVVSPAQKKVLKDLSKPKKLRELSDDPKTDPPRVHKLLKLLIKKGFVKQDLNTKKYSLTELGEVIN